MAESSLPSKRGERILVLTTSYPRFLGDSAGHFVQAEVTALRRQGHSVTVAAAGGPFTDRTVVDLGGADLFTHPGALPRLAQRPTRAAALIFTSARARRLVQSDFDRVVCHWLVPTAYLWGSAFASACTSLVAVAHGSDVRVLLKLPAVLRRIVLRSLLRSRFELRFVSAELKAALLAADLSGELHQYVERAEVRASPIECDGVPDKVDARRELGLGGQSRWAVIVGRLIEGKRPSVALSAASLIPELDVAIVGSGPLEKDLRERHPDFLFLGQLPRDEALKWISAADILIAASRDEGAPTAIREARALGTPVVSVSAGDIAAWAESDPDLWVIGHN